MTDSINLIADNKKLSGRYIEMLYPKKEDHRSGDEIALDVIQNLGLRFE